MTTTKNQVVSQKNKISKNEWAVWRDLINKLINKLINTELA